MAKKTNIHTSVDASNGLKSLLMDSDITITIAKAYPAIERVHLQIQRDLAGKLDDESALQILKGLEKLDDTLKLFQSEGNLDLLAEKN